MKAARARLSLMSPNALQILNSIADGLDYDGVLAQYPYFTMFDIADAAASATDFIDAVDPKALEPDVRRVMVGISKGYGYTAIQQVCQIEVTDIANSAFTVLEFHRKATEPRKKKRRRLGRRHGQREY